MYLYICIQEFLNQTLSLGEYERSKGKPIPVTGREDPEGCETSRFLYFLDNRLTDGGEVVSPTRRPPFTPRKIPGTHFCCRLSRPQGHSAAGKIRSIEKSMISSGIKPATFWLVA
jgi:hypothetical protein